jgi:hypothetical protein
MRKRTFRRLEVLENEERSRELQQQSSSQTISFFCWKVLLAYYVGGLNPDEEDPGEAEARALNYQSRHDYLEALFKGQTPEISERFKNAARRLFAQVDLDFDRSPPSALFEAFVKMVNQLPEQWLAWLKSNLQECPTAPIVASVPILKFLFNFCVDRECAVAEAFYGGQDIVGCLGPAEGFGVGVASLDIGIDRCFQVRGRAMGATLDLSLG